MSFRGESRSGDDGSPLSGATWLYSYGDLVTQLLLFAILMLTVLGFKDREPNPSSPGALEAAAKELGRLIQDEGLEGQVAVDRTGDRVVVRMTSKLLFQPGQAALTPDAEAVLERVSRLLVGSRNPLRVEGHTDDVPIHTAQFPSNWELSTARALAVVSFLENQGIEKARLSVAGYAEFHPLVANDSPEHRTQNRRVELVVLGEGRR